MSGQQGFVFQSASVQEQDPSVLQYSGGSQAEKGCDVQTHS